ncbi:MAG: DUF1513 domain-containing protein [Rhodobacteraceae bacterium]|nr:DUF1513 domain-containing protein [Paracoccaceae bacterium]
MPWTATEKTAFSRRAFLAGLGGASFLVGSALSKLSFAAPLLDPALLDAPLFASTRREANGKYALSIFDEAGMDIARVALPDRGHGMALSPDKSRMMVFARRPGTFAVLIDLRAQSEPQILSSIPGRHFYGHGCFSADGRLVYAVENDYEAVRGVLGVYDVSGADIQRIGEIETGGVGPHDLLLTEGGRSVVIANGGIQTDPKTPRAKLNVETMDPSVVYLDLENGDLLAQHRLAKDLHKLSLRHMAEDGAGRVWVGGQYEGDSAEMPPLVARFSRDEELKLSEIPMPLMEDLQSYIGSVVANNSGDVIATSAPRGGKTLFWDAKTAELIGSETIIDGCGVAPIDDSSFLVSDGAGGLSYVEEPDSYPEVLARPAGVSWDNHMIAFSQA